jgi:exopolysaccharide production protein ExoZ
MMQSESTKKIASLTGFRALAAAMVWLCHYVPSGDKYPLLWIFQYGARGVDFFFALSGFLFTVLYFDKRFDKKNLFAYFIKRITRIYPTYWLVMAIALLLEMLPEAPAIPSQRFSITDFLLNTFLLQGYYQHTVHAYLAQAWTLTVEELFYMCLPLLLFFIRSYCLDKPTSRVRIWKLVTFLIGIILIEIQFSGLFADFAMGIIGGLFALQNPQSKWINDKRLNSQLGMVGIAIFSLAVFLFGKQPDIWFEAGKQIGLLVTLSCGLSGTLLILSLYGNSWFRTRFENKVMVYCGKISFAFYLIHFHIIIYLKNPFLSVITSITGNGINWLPTKLFVALMIFLITGLLSAFIYEQIELPVQTYLRSLWLQGKRYQPKSVV